MLTNQLTAKLFNILRRCKTGLSDFEIQYKTPPIKKSSSVPMPMYGGRNTVTMIPGSGIGPELASYVQEVFRVGGVPVDFEICNINPNSDENDDLGNAITSIRRNRVAIKGNIERGKENAEVILRNVAIRNELDLYAYIVCCKSYAQVPAKHKHIDLVVIRQNTEGEYAMLEHTSVPGVVESLKIITDYNSTRVAKFAFEYAKKHGRKKITIVHKANIMKLADGLFLEACRKVAKNYPEIAHNDIIVDNCCMQLVSNPEQFDILLAPNLYGNIVTNIVCGLSGGPGLTSGKNYGDHYVVFEGATRNMGRLIAEQKIANPIALLNASADMLSHLGHKSYATMLQKAIERTLSVDKVHTKDLGGTNNSLDVVKKVIDNMLVQK